MHPFCNHNYHQCDTFFLIDTLLKYVLPPNSVDQEVPPSSTTRTLDASDDTGTFETSITSHNDSLFSCSTVTVLFFLQLHFCVHKNYQCDTFSFIDTELLSPSSSQICRSRGASIAKYKSGILGKLRYIIWQFDTIFNDRHNISSKLADQEVPREQNMKPPPNSKDQKQKRVSLLILHNNITERSLSIWQPIIEVLNFYYYNFQRSRSTYADNAE